MLRTNGKVASGLRINSKVAGGVRIDGHVVLFGEEPAGGGHTFTITPAVSGNRRSEFATWGYAAQSSVQFAQANPAGTITNATYRTPNGSNAIIRRVLTNYGIGADGNHRFFLPGREDLLFSIEQSGLTVADAAQFPDRIRLTNGSMVYEGVRTDPLVIGAVDEWIGVIYIRDAATSNAFLRGRLFSNSSPTPAVTVELFYPQVEPTHSYTFMSGTRSNNIGFWDGRAGSITDGTYQLPNGSNGRIRQTMYSTGNIGANQLRFLLNQSGLGTSDTAQFPDRIVITRGSNIVAFVPQDPVEINSFGQGIGQDYTVDGSGTPADVIVNGETSSVDLFYD